MMINLASQVAYRSLVGTLCLRNTVEAADVLIRQVACLRDL